MTIKDYQALDWAVYRLQYMLNFYNKSTCGESSLLKICKNYLNSLVYKDGEWLEDDH